MQQDLSFEGIIKFHEKIEKSTFTVARTANNSHNTLLYCQIKPLKQWLRVMEHNVFKLNLLNASYTILCPFNLPRFPVYNCHDPR